MYNDERLIINSKNYTIEELYEQYRYDKIIFCENPYNIQARKNKIIEEILDALSRGIPFPPIYVSELQTGQLLVLNKSHNLRFLLEFIDRGFDFRSEEEYKRISVKYERYYNRREILYSKINLHIIDYSNPRYRHMQAGAFIEEWTSTQEQSIRNILYKELDNCAFREMLSDRRLTRNTKLSLQNSFLYFIMVHLSVNGVFEDEIYTSYIKNVDRFELIEKTIYQMQYMNVGYFEELRDRFMSCYHSINSITKEEMRTHLGVEQRTNYICFLYAWRLIVGKDDFAIFYNRDISQMIQNCDMSYDSIKQILDCFKRGRV